ncbi:hypothetical protein T03_2169 [Trichinella britovi]|uniref:Uncharacterized protein n=1 Tax=Trichinella britovi TaxID=45882 RepID=A0A0V1CDF5_TRIBR|nr:hypothetical protein T03_2169 [Trichinella britovi]
MALITPRTSASVWYCTRAARRSGPIWAARKYISICSNQVSTFDDIVSTSGGLTHSGPSILPRSPFRRSVVIRAARKYISICPNPVSTFDHIVSISGGLTHSGPSILPRSPFVALVGATWLQNITKS